MGGCRIHNDLVRQFSGGGYLRMGYRATGQMIGRETVRDEAIAAKKKVIADKRRETYWKPENVAKRRAAKAERKRLRAEQAKKNLADAFRIVGEMFRGG